MSLLHGLLLFAAGFIAGMMNSIAGGGTLISFPALLWHGLSAIEANATNTVALWLGSLSSAWGYRQEVSQGGRKYLWLIVPSLLGGIIGAVLLRYTPPALFDALVPWLILFATLLLMIQEPVQRWLRRKQNPEAAKSPDQTNDNSSGWLIGALAYQFLASIYGGYFGAGMGIVMLAILGLIGLTDIHQMNGLKNLYAGIINLVAGIYFIASGLIDWPAALVMMAGAAVGGYASAGVARRLGRQFARRAVIGIGLLLTALLLFR